MHDIKWMKERGEKLPFMFLFVLKVNQAGFKNIKFIRRNKIYV